MLIHRIPAPPVAPFAALLWHADDWVPLHRRERHMPDGAVNIVMSLDPGRGGSAAVVSGPRSESFVVNVSPCRTPLVGVQFHHGGATTCFDIPIDDLRNRHVPLEDLIGRAAGELHERLLETRNGEQRLDLVETWLQSRIAARIAPAPAVMWAARQLRRPGSRVADVAAQIGRSQRWFIDRFDSEVGLKPKVFSRVQRFQAALRLAHREPSIDLAALAVGAGYVDQSHLTHEFARIAKMSPSAVIRGRTAFMNHVVD